ncbi:MULTISPECIES: MarR family transcriptional regulator [unclassified Streptomyces]|jgi:DNA-binding MarR family transcriptional regulator|uniref:MarR family winged helix-turn-helix transcriptional regulator n=1 Tax=unclassified Streptomyces TaxID=2593676 RepID=UPI000F4FD2BD|nr:MULTISPECIES: MarR family transcriptional regulator [unclassified Streptomyces]MDH6451302.1 DNA-binding MarR family transcriptional regulator [Streptomyces sp. SAI-119]MDH6498139.1 DNA-binding MarR family transcriptional regulator [Streptomyces sp. SAI-149]QUC63044.1 MarR family transcriptional regulator [Streptomyces sp. A2-16]GLP70626.1 transcriptional regulator [Streptomyces sp. TUS-ST3]
MHAEPRPDATAAQALEAMDFFIATAHLGQQEMAQRLGLNVTDLLSFACVLKAGEDLLTAGDLAEHAHVTTGAVTGILNRLERGGYVTRVPDPNDRRRVRVAALPDAVAKVVALYQPYYDRLDAVFASYSADEIAVLHDWFNRSTNLALAYIEELRAKDAEGE